MNQRLRLREILLNKKSNHNKYSNKIKELKTLLDDYHPDRAESHIFLFEPEYTPTSGFSKRKTAKRNRVK